MTLLYMLSLAVQSASTSTVFTATQKETVLFGSNETAAITFTEILATMDLLLLTATVDNRREIIKLQQALKDEQQKPTRARANGRA